MEQLNQHLIEITGATTEARRLAAFEDLQEWFRRNPDLSGFDALEYEMRLAIIGGFITSLGRQLFLTEETHGGN